jgi:O-antigen ligase
VAVAVRRASVPALLGLIILIGGAGGLVEAHRHALDPFLGLVLGLAAASIALSALIALEPAWILTAGLLLSVFSGNWAHMSVPLPLDRVAVLGGIGAAVVRSLFDDSIPRIRVRIVHWLMLLLVLYAVGSAAWSGTLTSHEPLFALLDRLGLVPFLLYLIAPVAFHSEHQRRILAVGLLVLGAYLGLITLFEAVHVNSLVIPHYILNPDLGIHAERGRGPFLEAGANGLAMFICLIAAVLTFPWWRDRRGRAVAIAVIVLCIAGILFTLTRQTWVGAAGGTVAAMLAHRRLRALLPITAAGAAVVVLLALAVVPGLSASVSGRTSSQGPVWDRLNSDAAALRMIAARPALGFGWGEFGKASVPYYRLAATYPLTSVGEAHNDPLSNAAELGLIGAGLWAVILVVGLGGAARRPRLEAVEPWRLGLIAVVVAWFIQANFTPLDYAFDNYAVWLWAGVVAAGPLQQRRGHIALRRDGAL